MATRQRPLNGGLFQQDLDGRPKFPPLNDPVLPNGVTSIAQRRRVIRMQAALPAVARGPIKIDGDDLVAFSTVDVGVRLTLSLQVGGSVEADIAIKPAFDPLAFVKLVKARAIVRDCDPRDGGKPCFVLDEFPESLDQKSPPDGLSLPLTLQRAWPGWGGSQSRRASGGGA